MRSRGQRQGAPQPELRVRLTAAATGRFSGLVQLHGSLTPHDTAPLMAMHPDAGPSLVVCIVVQDQLVVVGGPHAAQFGSGSKPVETAFKATSEKWKCSPFTPQIHFLPLN